ncbi:MAG TPA: sugar phosphate nucleotidyltransferase, partial [Candidatus Lokiarchaeia archaeon]
MLRPKNNLIKKILPVILCAGEGTRLKSITEKVPKPLITLKAFNNKPILEDLISKLIKLDVNKIAIVKGHLGNKIEEFTRILQKKNDFLRNRIVTIDSGEDYKKGPLYSFLSVSKLKKTFGKDFIYMVLPGDTIFEFDLLKTITDYIINNYKAIKQNPVIFYRNININVLKERFKLKNVSVANLGSQKFNIFLKKIETTNLMDIHESKDLNHFIPIIVMGQKHVGEILKLEKKSNVKTLR